MWSVIACVVTISVCIALPVIGILIENKGFNGGVCPRCGKKLRLFDCTPLGARGYTCDRCQYKSWVSYFTVDRKFLDETFKY